MWVLDASVYVACVTDSDRHHRRSRSWLESVLEAEDRLVAPNLLIAELAASVRRLTGKQDVAQRVVSELLEDGLIEPLPVTQERSLRAADIAAAAGVRGADAVYLALAQELAATLVTLDRQILKRGKPVARVQRP